MRGRSIILIIALGIVLLVIRFLPSNKSNTTSATPGDNNAYRNTSHLILTKHARCRMDCRHITEDEIKEIIQKGEVNNNKSGPGSKGDYTYALEGYDNEQQHLRIVVAPEDDGLVVITCIDLDHDWTCNCD